MSFKTTRIKFGKYNWIRYKNILFSYEVENSYQNYTGPVGDLLEKDFFNNTIKYTVDIKSKMYHKESTTGLVNILVTKQEVRDYLTTLKFNEDFEDKLK